MAIRPAPDAIEFTVGVLVGLAIGAVVGWSLRRER
jgi:NhaP-type Na+/H+ or K+/H+ antiporter